MHDSLQFPTKRVMQERFLQRRKRGKFLLIDGFEALGFFTECIKFCNYGMLFN